MKAINFLDWYKQNILLVEGTLEEYEANHNATIKVWQFYSQPFKPEMIVELFEGWCVDRHTDEEPVYYNRQNGENIRVWFDLCKTIFYIPNKSHNDDIVWELPKTLDHFIIDCERAGIELTFKPEIVEKYFK